MKVPKFSRLRLAETGVNPDHDEALGYQEADAWIQFASAAMTGGNQSQASAELADDLILEFRKRFDTGPTE